MKKIFTLIAMATMALGANAQESYLVNADTNPSDYEEIWYKATNSVKLYYGKDGEWANKGSLNTADGDFRFDDFTHYVSGNQNPKDGATPGSGSGYTPDNKKNPKSGTYYGFKPSAAGSIEAGIILNPNKNFYLTDSEGNSILDYDIKDYTGVVVELDKDSKAAAKVYGKVTFNVEANKEYYIFCTGSKLGFMGFKYNTTAATIDSKTTAKAKGEGGGGDDPQPGEQAKDGTFIISSDGTSANKLTYSNGFTLQITGNLEKTYSGASKITIDGNEYTSIKLSNGAENTLTLPSGQVASGITIYSYVNKDAATERDSYWKEVAGVSYKELPQGGIFTSYKDLANPDKCTYDFGEGRLNAITFTNTGEQCCFVIQITIATGTVTPITGIETVKSETINLNAPMFNLAGQKVAEGYKGVVIQNGVKRIQK